MANQAERPLVGVGKAFQVSGFVLSGNWAASFIIGARNRRMAGGRGKPLGCQQLAQIHHSWCIRAIDFAVKSFKSNGLVMESKVHRCGGRRIEVWQ
jgi:hypothetical protein